MLQRITIYTVNMMTGKEESKVVNNVVSYDFCCPFKQFGMSDKFIHIECTDSEIYHDMCGVRSIEILNVEQSDMAMTT